jgi:hypothetical protein
MMKAIKLRTKAPFIPSGALISRLEDAYEYLMKNSEEDDSALWLMITNKNSDIHDALLKKDGSSLKLFSNPSSTNLYYGVDNLAADIMARIPDESTEGYEQIRNLLASLGEALGLINIHNPEQIGTRGGGTPELKYILNCLAHNDENFTFPNPFDGEFGIVTEHGLISYRAVQAYYQSQLLMRICDPTKAGSVLEIGAGMGRTAYFAHLNGMSYSIVDLPLGLMGQALFLAATLGEESFRFQNEENSHGHRINLIGPNQFAELSDKYHVIINVDSLTEMGETTANEYISLISEKAELFLSINHDVNDFSVNELVKRSHKLKLIYRSQYWLRVGYCEELYISRAKTPFYQNLWDYFKLPKRK